MGNIIFSKGQRTWEKVGERGREREGRRGTETKERGRKLVGKEKRN